ncbi:type II toxin-antitoxin system VapB family antitoxin [Microbacterium sp.]|uniref:type II toxin-antitoxin system VapB family antitoxin n=1 Tax=Microbacterium sp. TaxID=51671 RepID=UPI0039E53825
MARTNVDIDERLIAEVMGRYRLESKRSAVDFALRSLIAQPMTRSEILAMRGSGIEFDNDEVEGEWMSA